MITEEIRSYEVSIWTLQDEFITVLKWSDIEQKGSIQEAKMTLNIDGTEKLEFKIPMYIYDQGRRIENPNWYNTRNGNLMINMRKIKVIFNKGTENKAVYEFLIINVEETHEKDNLFCVVQCEGLAFHELGKIGYKFNLSQDIYALDLKSYEEREYWYNKNHDKMYIKPMATVSYWCDKIGLDYLPDEESERRSNIWYYRIQMDWGSFKNRLSILNNRFSNQVYEESYPKAWNTTTLMPTEYEEYREKCRIVSAENSNIYNITQTIAEKFEIFCRYEYGHDENNNITSRTIIFYNNFIQEGEEGFSLTYPYSSSKITRKMNSQDLTTKLFVLTADDETTARGYNTIMNSEANATREDYILNFNYLYANKIISDEQYNAIKPYEIEMRSYNDQMIIQQQLLETYRVQEPEYEAKLKFYEESMKKDNELIGQNAELQNAISAQSGSATGKIIVNENHPDYCLIQTDKNGSNFISLSSNCKGVSKESIKLYYKYDSSNHILSDEVKTFIFETDDYDFPYRVRGIAPKTETINGRTKTYNAIYATYEYEPNLYYETIGKIWSSKLAQDTKEYNKYADLLGEKNEETGEGISGLYKTIDETTENIAILQLNKQKAIQRFERLMGAALREGYWQPEDYSDYGDSIENTKTLSSTWTNSNKNNFLNDTGTSFYVGWDDKLFDEEEKNYYEIDITQSKIYYPCIDLSNIYDSIKNDIGSYRFIFNNNYAGNELNHNSIKDARYVQQFAIGSQALLQFVRHNNTIIPVLILVGAKTMSDDAISFMKGEKIVTNNNINYSGNPCLAKIRLNDDKTVYIDNNGLISYTNQISVNFINLNETYTTVYPRIKFSSLDLKADSNDMVIKYNDILLEVAKDYYVNTRNTERTANNTVVYYPEYYITIKPETIFKSRVLFGNVYIQYILSNANTAIYLDALKISKENAEPKVEYEVTATIFNKKLLSTLYNQLAHIVMINDTDLKFKNVFGYISGLELNLDKPSEDTIEVKNYKTKFEDLFSTIVAQTEEMKKSGAGFIDAAAGNVSLKGGALLATIEANNSILSAYLDTYFDSSQVVKDRLQSLFAEASQILGDSSNTLNSMRSLTLENAEILNSFARNIASELSAQVTVSAEKPLVYKPGDIWIDLNGDHWMATGYSYESDASGTDGFVRTHYGTFASITGAGMNVDAEKGLFDIYAENEIKLRSGKHIAIDAQDTVDIFGNKSVNIAGATINITGETVDDNSSGGINIISTKINMKNKINSSNKVDWHTDTQYYVNDIVYYNNSTYKCMIEHNSGDSFDSAKWQNYVSIEDEIENGVKSIDTNISKVLIHSDKIEMGSADIFMNGANTIQMVTSRGSTSNTSAVEISAQKGIWIGSGKGVRIFSGEVAYDSTTRTVSHSKWNACGASVELNSQHLILGYANTSVDLGNTIEMTEDYVVIASGGMLKHPTVWVENQNYQVNDLVNYNDHVYKCSIAHTSGSEFNQEYWIAYTPDAPSVTGTSNGLVGAKFTKDSIGFAIQNGNKIDAILMNENGITIGSGSIDVTLPTTSNDNNNLRASDGSYIRINGEGIELGSLADLYINTNNFKLQTHSRENGDNSCTLLAVGKNLSSTTSNQDIGENTAYNVAGLEFKNGEVTINEQRGLDVQLLLNKNGLYIKGNVYANSLYATGEDSYFMANDNQLGFYRNDNNNALLEISASGLVCSGAFIISATNLKLGTVSSSKTIKKYYEDGDSSVGWVKTTGIEINNNDINISATGTLTVMNNASNSAIILNKNGITATTKATVDFSAAKEIKLKANSISMAAISDYTPPDMSNYYSVVSGVTINTSGVDIVGSKRVYMGTQTFANKENGTYIWLSTNEINIKATDGAFKINGVPVWARGDIVYSSTKPTSSQWPVGREWLWIQPIGYEQVTYNWASGQNPYTTGTIATSGAVLNSSNDMRFSYTVVLSLIGNNNNASNNYTITVTVAGNSYQFTGVNFSDSSGFTYQNATISHNWTVTDPSANPCRQSTLNYSIVKDGGDYPIYCESFTLNARSLATNGAGSECKVFYFPADTHP